MSSLALYRALIQGHDPLLVVDATVNTWLALAAKRHSATAFGAVFPEAMVFWAAHKIETTPGTGAGGSGSSGATGPVLSKKDGDLAISYGAAGAGSSVVSGSDADYLRTTYGFAYLDLRNSRSAVAPGVVGAL